MVRLAAKFPIWSDSISIICTFTFALLICTPPPRTQVICTPLPLLETALNGIRSLLHPSLDNIFRFILTHLGDALNSCCWWCWCVCEEVLLFQLLYIHSGGSLSGVLSCCHYPGCGFLELSYLICKDWQSWVCHVGGRRLSEGGWVSCFMISSHNCTLHTATTHVIKYWNGRVSHVILSLKFAWDSTIKKHYMGDCSVQCAFGTKEVVKRL